MKITKHLLTTTLITGLAVGIMSSRAADQNNKAKPYPLDKCVVSGEKLDSMGKPHVFTENGQEIKLCCKDCLKDYKKDKSKYLKKVEEAQKK